jgi:hypothetical protein
MCMRRNACSSSCHAVIKLIRTKSKWEFFVKFSNIQFYQIPSTGSRIVIFRKNGYTQGSGAPYIREHDCKPLIT